MRLHPDKKAIRAFGVAESFRKGDRRSALCGVVMRSDRVIDGVRFGLSTVGGDDATASIITIYQRLGREDVNVLIISGCIISHYNFVDPDAIAAETGRPVICLTYRESTGIEGAIRSHFVDAEEKVRRYRGLGARVRLETETGQTVFARLASISERDARAVIGAFTLQGGVPEPVRVAKLLAHALRSSRQRPI